MTPAMRTSRNDTKALTDRRRDDRLVEAVTALIHQAHTVGVATTPRSAVSVGAPPAHWELGFERAPAAPELA